MEKVDRLIIKAKQAARRKAERFTIGFVSYDPGRDIWEAKGTVWNGKPGQARTITTEHDSMEAALAALEALADDYPNVFEDAVILIDDLDQ